MEDEVKLTKWGYGIRTSSDDCISAINEFYDQVLSYGRRRSVILEATVHDKDCVLANVLAAHFLSSSDSSRAHYHLQAAKAGVDRATPYEKAVFDAISYLMSNDRDDNVAVELHTELLKNFPKDLSSLKRAQVLCFYLGSDDLSLALVEQVLPQNQEEGFIYGMLAFSLLELGCMEEAEKAARRGLDIDKKDSWAQHALCHVLQYRCHFKEAVEFMEACSPSWRDCGSFMVTHNWWHVALCYLEANSPPSKILELYDNYIWKELEKPDAMGPEVYLNALGLMLRLFVRGEFDPCEGRLKILANVLTDKANWHLEWHFDILTSWALAKAGETFAADKLLGSLKSRLLKMTSKKREKMQRGVLLAEALYKYGRGDYEHALDLLGLDFDANDYKMIGASNEQLDVFNEVWYDILMNTGHTAKAIEVIEKQAKRREEVPYLWHLLERGYNKIGRPEEAAIAGDKARSLEKAHFK
ncbi:tetratricopeptide repeat protein 38 isoform X1 [Cucumis melo var. makuwa]|uniref:Tetratricopeptide repeat protein 38 n=2 Tax=Cucumis melo TaxID=3656 RepID=A0A5A7STS3_CUCMM|nr:tetratricopeptide repeat protein 38 isoform X1 [Cucumis melo var. makuwa]TYK15549.1 tetratricopeptide repeat protein 38 isoform X1 [Cucumis melo var. makuwa]